MKAFLLRQNRLLQTRRRRVLKDSRAAVITKVQAGHLSPFLPQIFVLQPRGQGRSRETTACDRRKECSIMGRP